MATTTIAIREARLNFPNLFTPEEFMGKMRYSTQVLVPIEGEEADKIKDVVDALVAEAFGANIPANLRLPYVDGDEEADAKDLDDDAKTRDYLILKTSAKLNDEFDVQPKLVGLQKEPLEDKSKIYSGVIADVVVGLSTYKAKKGQPGNGVTAYPKVVRWRAVGENWGGSAVDLLDDLPLEPTTVADADDGFLG